jgi:hypothetical protein
MRLVSLLVGLLLAGCGGVQELVCRLEGDAGWRIARPVFQATQCVGFPCTPPMLAGAPVWTPAGEQAYQTCHGALGLAALRGPGRGAL